MTISFDRNYRHIRLPSIILTIIVLLSFFSWTVTGAGLAEVGVFVLAFFLVAWRTRFNTYARIIAFLFISVLVSSFWGSALGYDLQVRIVFTFLISAAFVASVCSYSFNKSEIDFVFDLYILASVIGALFILYNVFNNHQYGYMRYSVTFWGVDRDSLYVCAYQAGALYMCTNRMLRAEKRRLLYALFSITITIGGFFTGNRSFVLLLGFVIVYTFVCAFLKSKNRAILILVFIIIVSLSVVLFISIQRIMSDYIVQRIFTIDSLTDNETRTTMWKESFDLFLKHPMFGIGLENNNRYLRTNGLRYSHNVFLDLLCSQGLVGFGIFLWLIIYPIAKSNNVLYTLGFAISSLMTLFFVNGYNTMTFWIPVLLIVLQSKYCVE